MKIPKGLYDALKYIALIGGPGVATFIMVVGPVWDWSNVDQIVKTIVAADALLGTLLVLNSAQYTKDQKVASLVTDEHPAALDPVVASEAMDPANPLTPTEALKRQEGQ